MDIKFIHAADLHIDSPLCGLARYEGAPVEQMQSATRRAFVNLVNLACQEAVDFVLLAGDLYDVDWKDYNTGLFFNQQMSQLREADIPVFLIRGNHDAGSSITRQLRLPDNVKEFSTQHPETALLDNLGVAIHGQSFAEKVITDDLSKRYPVAIPDYYNIGLLHTSLTGREGHAPYAPCTVSNLLTRGYDYWALGHIHHREVIHEHPYIVFPGNTQGRHVRESGTKGCTLVQFKENQTTLTHQPTEVLRWEVCHVEAENIKQAEEIIEKTQEAITQLLKTAHEKPLAIRFVITGASPAHTELLGNPERWENEIRALATDAGAGNIWVEKVALKTQTAKHHRSQVTGALELLINTLHQLPDDVEKLHALGSEFRQLKQALPPELHFDEKEYMDPEHPETIRHFLNRVEKLLIARLFSHE